MNAPVVVKSHSDLAEGAYRLPNWKLDCAFRYTAWSYLNRDDGGDRVELIRPAAGEKAPVGTIYTAAPEAACIPAR